MNIQIKDSKHTFITFENRQHTHCNCSRSLVYSFCLWI